jgi:hypothetical protein
LENFRVFSVKAHHEYERVVLVWGIEIT